MTDFESARIASKHLVTTKSPAIPMDDILVWVDVDFLRPQTKTNMGRDSSSSGITIYRVLFFTGPP